MAITGPVVPPLLFREGIAGQDDQGVIGPATPHGHRNSNSDWRFPFTPPGRWAGRHALPSNSEKRTPWVDADAYDAMHIPPRFVPSPVPLEEVKRHVLGIADDAGIISIHHPAIAHEIDEIRYVY